MTIVYILLFSILLFLPVSVFSVAAWCSLIWGFPMLFEMAPTPASVVYSIFTIACMLAHSLRRRHCIMPTVNTKISSAAYFIYISLLLAILVADSGLSGFLSGKYGRVPGGNIYLYYMWNSSLFLAFVLNMFSMRFPIIRVVALSIGLLLLLISGDRTILGLVLIAAVFRFTNNMIPATFLRTNLKRTSLLVCLFAALYIGKDFYGGYASGFTLYETFSRIDLKEILMRLEFWHTYNMFNKIYLNNLSYPATELLRDFIAFVPGSSRLGVDPHQFSQLVKANFYWSWSETSGVGANLFGQAYAVASHTGLLVLMAVMLLILKFLEVGLHDRRQIFVCVSLVLVPVIAFYAHRNSVAQILSFSGRYITLTIFMVAISSFFRFTFRISRGSVERPRVMIRMGPQ